MTGRHLPWGWSCGGLPGLAPAVAVGLAPGPPAPCRLTLSLPLAGLFKISSMEKDRPSFFGASQHPRFSLSVPSQRAGPASAFSMGGGKEGRGSSV